ncbi:MAG: hypothetical protein ABID38_02815 [Candidatus Diapherotrites archaeon]
MDKMLMVKIGEIKDAFSKNRPFELKRLSNELIQGAVVDYDETMAELAIVAYSLNKLNSKEHIVNSKKWADAKKTIIESMDEMANAVEADDEGKFSEILKDLSQNVTEIDGELGNYVQNVYDKARVKMASNAYAMGLSLGQAAELTKADKKNLQSYIGNTLIHDRIAEKTSIGTRVEKLKKLFG